MNIYRKVFAMVAGFMVLVLIVGFCPVSRCFSADTILKIQSITPAESAASVVDIRAKDYFDIINEEMKRNLKSRVPLIEEIGAHALFGGGKRLRPLFFVLCCRLCGYPGEDLYILSTIFEYVHAASLLHDDVLDNAEVRRKKPTANNVWGNNAAVLEGDFLFSNSMSVALRAKNLEFLNVLSRASLKMTEGQIMELVHTDDWSLGKDKYLEIIEAKTATLISVACASGAIISGADKKKGEALADFGINVGIAFQALVENRQAVGPLQLIVGNDDIEASLGKSCLKVSATEDLHTVNPLKAPT